MNAFTTGRSAQQYDALLIVSFGGPERRDDVLPFLENVLRKRNVPRQRMLEVAEHYYHFGGVSPINQQNRELVAAIRQEFERRGLSLPVYWGNRNWQPYLADTMRDMAAAGVRRALGFFTTAYSSYSSCRQYLENIVEAKSEVGPHSPDVDKLRAFFNHPLFIEAMTERVAEAMVRVPPDGRGAAPLLFTAHSIPQAMAENCRYEAQLRESCRLVADSFPGHAWQLVYQSRSGSPSQPWLGPDVGETLGELAAAGITHVVVVPIGFLSDHMEVLYDLDVEATEQATQCGLTLIRASTVGVHPKFIEMVGDLVLERLDPTRERAAIGELSASHDACAPDCCPPPARQASKSV